ncbi:helix-turn-helix domain-containing protein [Streptomyces sp. NPDC004008]
MSWARRLFPGCSQRTQTQVASALETRRETVANWELGKTEPRPPRRAAYARLLRSSPNAFPARLRTPRPRRAKRSRSTPRRRV